MKEVLLSTRV
uniref:Uncharacterized protein n=1 Tax=Timema bartmani TaxID=61472 RepID=A0A7R9FEC8_9NEOP|nr:unnamed protein product [Timema bartmani]